MTATFAFARYRRNAAIGAALLFATAAALTLATPIAGHAGEPRAATQLQAKPLPPQPGKEVFERKKPHLNVGTVPARPGGPGGLKAQHNELADWYCGEGSGPGGYAQCTDELVASCNGTYKPPGTNGPQQTWGMCHERS